MLEQQLFSERLIYQIDKPVAHKAVNELRKSFKRARGNKCTIVTYVNARSLELSKTPSPKERKILNDYLKKSGVSISEV